jgi:Flp pilus assembly protein TadG
MNSLRVKRTVRNRRKWLRGATFVEFAIVALPMLMLTFGIIAFGMAVYSYSFVSNAARDAVRYAIVHGNASLSPASSSDIQQYVRSEAYGLNSTGLSVATTWAPDNKPGSVVKVQVTYSFHPFYPMSSMTLPLSSSAQMVISR